MPTEAATFAQYALPVIGLVVGWLIKNKLPAIPNAVIPAVLGGIGAAFGFWLLPSVGVERCVALMLGATVIRELYGLAATKEVKP